MRVAITWDMLRVYDEEEEGRPYVVRERSDSGKCLDILRGWMSGPIVGLVPRLCFIPVREGEEPSGEVLAVVEARSVDEVLEKIVEAATTKPVEERIPASPREIVEAVTGIWVEELEEATRAIDELLRRLGIRVKKWVFLGQDERETYRDIVNMGTVYDRDDKILRLYGDIEALLLLDSGEDAARARRVLRALADYVNAKKAEEKLVKELGERLGMEVAETVDRLLRRHYYTLREGLVYTVGPLPIKKRKGEEELDPPCTGNVCLIVYLRHGRLGIRIGSHSYEEEIPQQLAELLRIPEVFKAVERYALASLVTKAMSRLVAKRSNGNTLLLIPLYELPLPLRETGMVAERIVDMGRRYVAVLRARELYDLCRRALEGRASFKAVALQGEKAVPVNIYMEPEDHPFPIMCDIIIEAIEPGKNTVERKTALPA